MGLTWFGKRGITTYHKAPKRAPKQTLPIKRIQNTIQNLPFNTNVIKDLILKMSLTQILHTVMEEDGGKVDMFSSRAPEIVKSTFSETRIKTQELSENKDFIMNSDFDCLGKMWIEITLPALKFSSSEHKVVWRSNVGAHIIKTVKSYIHTDNKSETLFCELSSPQIIFHHECLSSELGHDEKTNLLGYTDKPSDGFLQTKTLCVELPFYFTQRDSLNFPLFKLRGKKLRFDFNFETDFSNLLEFYRYQDKNGKRFLEETEPFEVECEDEIIIGSVNYEATSLSLEDKTKIDTDRLYEVFDVYESVVYPLDSNILEIPLQDRMPTSYHTITWYFSKPLTEFTSSLHDGTKYLYENLDKRFTSVIFPTQKCRRLSKLFNVWSNCSYLCDMGAKPCIPFKPGSALSFSFPKKVKGVCGVIKISQILFKWENNTLKLIG